ncbi:MAG: DUF5763 domain-containing protein [Candidatus Acidiferrales bacterium]
MDRFQTVNGGQDTMHPTAPMELRPPDFGDEEQGESATAFAPGPARGTYGTCLYLGPSGQRCERRALSNGFCGRHSSSAAPRLIEATDAGSAATPEQRTKDRVRAVAAVLGLLGVLWPVVADIVKAILSFLNRK